MLLVLATFLLLSPSVALAQEFNDNNDMQENLEILGVKIGLGDANPMVIIARIIKIGLGFMGVILLLIILSAGFQFMTSGGDETKTAAAKKSFYSAIIGTIIILMSYSIVSLVINTVGDATGASTAI
ncbi:MAG: hypothetical protein A3J93_00585 [Candidatus Magasanikbacteria bacterium RIFOXYC2_FULL_42_28]|uniref:Uncharacterized protein n=1 Tax=Candidatus Magasanikbacteria bacterium RIFOXYC2_FULL_42_28 TaxID=1798704 RepID=A0A1F6NY59_9BACT|nr:MAG: hypothetical protein A3J93_00585 [Candidatus Magasanikbacteria bacterium RIFOXYC2_FULL_42_28]